MRTFFVLREIPSGPCGISWQLLASTMLDGENHRESWCCAEFDRLFWRMSHDHRLRLCAWEQATRSLRRGSVGGPGPRVAGGADSTPGFNGQICRGVSPFSLCVARSVARRHVPVKMLTAVPSP